MGSLKRNLRQALRMLRKQPGFSALAVLVLALGIGANSAMFSLVNVLLFKPLVIAEPDAIVGCYSRSERRPDDYRAFSFAEYEQIRASGAAFESLAAHIVNMVGLREGETTRRVFSDTVSSNYFATFGAPLASGRPFTAAEERPGAGIPVAIVSYPFAHRLGASGEVLGRELEINNRTFTVVGVAARGFTGSSALVSPELFVPLGMYETVANDFMGSQRDLADGRNRTLILVGRLLPGLDPASADAQLTAAAGGVEGLREGEDPYTLVARPLSRLSISTSPQSDAQLRLPALLLAGLAGIVLLIAALNVANMMLARGAARRREVAIRLALGAGRRALVAQLFVEGLVLALAGGAAGLALAYLGTDLLVRSLGRLAPIELAFDVVPDGRVLLATLAFSLLGTLVFSLMPAWNLSRPEVARDLKPGVLEPVGKRRPRRLLARRNLLVAGQIALSLALLSVAGLFARSAFRAASVTPGFELDGQLVVEIDPSLAGYDQARGEAVVGAALERLRALPGVESASVGATVPFGMVSLGRSTQRASDPPSDAQDPDRAENVVGMRYNVVGRDYFRTLGIPLERGRSFSDNESRAGAPAVVVLDRMAAERLWPDQEAVGRRIRLLGEDTGGDPVEAEVVGVVGSVQEGLIGRAISPHVYVPFGQAYQSNLHFHVRLAPSARASIAGMANEVRRILREVDPQLPVLSLRTLHQHLEASLELWLVRTASRIFSVFGLVAVILASAGLYGVRAFTVARRTREIGIRMAIGSSAGQALRLVMREGMALTALGGAIGLVLSLALGRLLAGLLYDVSGTDPVVFVTAPAVLAAASLLACYVPARRAARIHPVDALRSE